MTTNLPKAGDSKSLQFHQVINIILTVALGSGLTSAATFFYSINNSIILLSSKLETVTTHLDKINESMEKRIDKLEDRIRTEEMKK
jgi:hypothetical protein